MKNIVYAAVAVLITLSTPLLAFANVSHSPQAPTNPQPFTFSCAPYTDAFIDGNYYKPAEEGTCTFTLPTSGQQVAFLIFEGAPGNAQLIDFDSYNDIYTNVQDGPIDFNPPFTQGQDYFAAEFTYNSGDDLNNAASYLAGGGTPPDGVTINTVQWKYGDTPVVTHPLTVTADNQTIAFGGTLPKFTATLSGFVAPDTVSSNDVGGSAACTTTATASSPAGTYPITCTVGTLQSTNYTFDTFTAGTLTILPPVTPQTSPLTVTADNKTIELGGALPALTATLSGFVAPDTSASNDVSGSTSCTTTATPTSPVGTYPITCTAGTFHSARYTFTTFVQGTLSIVDTTAPVVTITSPSEGATYLTTDTVPFTANVTDASNAVTTKYYFNNVQVTPGQPLNFAGAPLGDPAVTVVATDASNNTTTSSVEFTLKGPLTLTADNKTIGFGSAFPTLTGTLSGYLNGDTLQTSGVTGSASCSTTATASSPAGTYPITCATGSLASNNYIFSTFVQGTLTIAKANQSITSFTVPTSGTVGSTGSVSASASSGLPVSLTASGACTLLGATLTYTTVGTCRVVAQQAGNTNYNAAVAVSKTVAVGYRWDGFLQPINDTAHQIGVATSVFKAGSTVPVKFQLKKADGTVIQATALPQWLTPIKLGAMSSSVDESIYTDSPTSGNTFKWDGSQYQYNWSTKGFAAGYWYQITAQADDGEVFWVIIGLR